MKQIRVYGKEVKYKNNKGREQSFISWSYTNKNGEFFRVKFKKTVENIPTESGYYLVKVDNLSIEKTQENYNDILWVGSAQDFMEDKLYTEERKKLRSQEVEDLINDVDEEL